MAGTALAVVVVRSSHDADRRHGGINSGNGQVIVAAETVTIIVGTMTKQQCAPERMRADEDLLAALNEATTWRREGEVLRDLVPEFERAHPGVRVRVQQIPWSAAH